MHHYHDHSDQQLTDLLKSGDQRAFTELYNRYWKLIYAHVYKMLKSEEDAKDIVQEVFSGLWTKSSSIKHNANIAEHLNYVKSR